MSKIVNEHPESRALEDAAWNLKDLAADTNARVQREYELHHND